MAQAVHGRARNYATRPKKWAAKNAKDRCRCEKVRNLACSDRGLGVRVIAEKLNMNRETVRQIVKEALGIRKFP